MPLTRDRESPSFVVDHEAPQVSITPREKKAVDRPRRRADPAGEGRLRPRRRSLDARSSPTTGCSTTPREQITLALPDLKPGVHLLMVRATDAAGNVGSGDSLIVVRN